MTKAFIDLDQYTITEHVGEGPLGDIHLLKSKETDLTFSIKILKKSISKNDEKKETKKFLNELKSLTNLNYPSITGFIGFSPIQYSNNNTSAIVSNFVSNTSLHQIIQQAKNDQFNDTAKLITIYGIAAGLSYLHSQNVVHCNLKTENIMMDNDYFPFITDFALSKIIHEKLNKKTIDSSFKIHGTVLYLPPEFFSDYKYTKQCDVYAFSMIMYEILTGEKPFNNYDSPKIVKKVSQNRRPKFNSKISRAFQNLIEKCWDQDPNNRPTFDQIVDQLKNDSSFITDLIDNDKYSNYIEKLSNSKSDNENEAFVKTRKAKSETLHTKEKNVKAKKAKSDNLDDMKAKSSKKKKSKSDKDNDVKDDKNDVDKEKNDKDDKEGIKEKKSKAKKTKSENLDEVKVKSDKSNELKDKKIDSDEEEKVKVKKSKAKKTKSENLDEVKAKSAKKKKTKNDFDDDELKIKSDKEKVKSKSIETKSSENNKKEQNNDEDENEEKAQEILEMVKESRKELNNILSGQKPKNYKENDPEAQKLFEEKIKKLEEETAKQQEEEEENQLTTLNDEEDEKRKQDMTRYKESICKAETVKKSVQFLIYKEKNDRKAMFETAKDLYFEAIYGYSLNQNKFFISTKQEALKKLEITVDGADMEIIGLYGMFLYNAKPTDPPDYEKIGKHLRNAGVNGRYYDCLELYLTLIEEGNIVIKDCEDVGLLYERLSSYAIEINMIKEAKKHLKHAVKHYMKGISLKQPGSMFRYANLIQEGKINGKKNQDLNLYIKGSKLNHPGSMFKYGLWLEKSKDKSDKNNAIELYKKAADKKYPDAMYKYAQILEQTCMIKADRLKAIDLYQKAADLNHADSMYRYAQILEEGIHINANKSKALEYYKKAADCQILKYILNYAEIVKSGRLGFVNFIEASDYYRIAYNLCNDEALSHYSKALFFNDEQKTLASKQMSVEYYKLAADNGNTNAMFDYATILHVGQLTKMNKAEAAIYFKMAADNGHAEAMYNYGTMLKNGDGIPANKAEADKYLFMANHK